jgi:choline kinase
MKVIILAAGMGTRLMPHTNDRPKCMVSLAGKSILSYQLQVLKNHGLDDITIVTGYQQDKLIAPGAARICNDEYATTNMAHSLFCARDVLSREQDVLVAYADIIYSDSVLDSLLAATSHICVTVDLKWRDYWCKRFEDPLGDAETLKLDANGRILELGQRPHGLDDIQGQYIGLMKFSAEGVAALKTCYDQAVTEGTLGGKSVEKAYMTDLLQHIIDSGYAVQSVPIHGQWIEIDSKQDLVNPATIQRLKDMTIDRR